jgi:hypothetical protein
MALLCLVPWTWRHAFLDQTAIPIDESVPGFGIAMRALSNFGVASLVIILIGLIVTWLGYIQRIRWTWFVMFVIAWFWAFPLLVLPLLTHTIPNTFRELLYNAMYQRGSLESQSIRF